MKKTRLLKTTILALFITLLLVFVLGIYMIYTFNNVDWVGNYKDTFTTLDEQDSHYYHKLSPSLKIEDAGDNYSIEVKITSSRASLTTSSLPIDGGTVGGYYYGPLEVPKTSVGRHHIFQFTSPDTPDNYVFFCEVEYLDESHIKLRYAKTKEELETLEFYTLPKLKYSSMGW